jgi:hypothetical protein
MEQKQWLGLLLIWPLPTKGNFDMRRLTKTQIEKMTPEQADRVAKELSAVMVSAMALKKARLRIAELEQVQRDRNAAAQVQQDIAEVVKALESASPSERLALALAAARAGQAR